jgi:hypothetical protein
LLFPNFSLGERYAHTPQPSNRQITPYLPTGRFRSGFGGHAEVV